MRDSETLIAMRDAKLKSVKVGNEPFKRYEIQFPDGVIPEELKAIAQNTEIARIVGSQITTVPDEAIIAHLKVHNQDEADISLTVVANGVGAMYSLDVPLHPSEKHLFDKEIQAISKKQKFDRADD